MNYSHLWNDLSFDERTRLQPFIIEQQIQHLEQARAVLVKEQTRVLAELDK